MIFVPSLCGDEIRRVDLLEVSGFHNERREFFIRIQRGDAAIMTVSFSAAATVKPVQAASATPAVSRRRRSMWWSGVFMRFIRERICSQDVVCDQFLILGAPHAIQGVCAPLWTHKRNTTTAATAPTITASPATANGVKTMRVGVPDVSG